MLLRFATGTIDTTTRRVHHGEAQTELRDREAQLLEHLARHADAVIDRDTLQTDVFGYAEGVTSRAVDTTVRRLRKKLALVGAADRLQSVYGEGYRWTRGVEPISGPASLPLDADLVQVVGPGGAGKTSRVRATLEGVSGVTWVGLRSDAGPAEAIAGALGLHAADSEAIAGWLHANPAATLVLDDAEAAWTSLPSLLQQWRRTASLARVVVISRIRMDLPGARVVPVRGLSTVDGTELFRRETRAVLDDTTVTALVEQLGGLPLGILLAARLAHLLEPSALPAALSDVTLQERGDSMARVLSTTLALLSPPSRQALATLAALPGPLPRDAVHATLGTASLQTVDQLERAFLLDVGPEGFAVHPQVADWVGIAPDTLQLGRWLTWVADAIEASLDRPQRLPTGPLLEAARSLAPEHAPKLLPVVCWGLLQRRVRDERDVLALSIPAPETTTDPAGATWLALCRAAQDRWRHPNPVDGAHDAVERTRGRSGAHLEALGQRARIHAYRGEADAARTDAEALIAVATTGGNATRGWLTASSVYIDLNESDRAERLLVQIEPFLDELMPYERSFWSANRVVVAPTLAAFLERSQQSLALATALGRPSALARATGHLASALTELGKLDEALPLHLRAVELAEASSPWVQVLARCNLSAHHSYALRWDDALRWVGAALQKGREGRPARLAAGHAHGIYRQIGLDPGEIRDRLEPHAPGHDDLEWFLWTAQAGDDDRALALARESALPPPHGWSEADVFRAFAIGQLLFACEAFPEAAALLGEVVRRSDPLGAWRVAFGAAWAAAEACCGRTPPLPVSFQGTPYHTFIARCWAHVHAAALGSAASIEPLDAWIAGSRPTSELAWRVRTARRLAEAVAP